jgi:uncharacterized protein (DUF1501 family)
VTNPRNADTPTSRYPRFAGVLGAEFEPVMIGLPTVARTSASIGDTYGQNDSRLAVSVKGKSGDESPHSKKVLADSRVRRARDLAREPHGVRERYGGHRFGQSCLLARRLVEAGVRFVTVETSPASSGGLNWDVHGRDSFRTVSQMRDETAPMYDQAYSALLEDLDRRGLLVTTLVCCVAEFGRTPRVNAAAGRDHWPHCFTCCFAGGGVRGGRLVGRSDATGSYPLDRPTPPADIAATIYHILGLDPRILSQGSFGTPATPSLPTLIGGLF